MRKLKELAFKNFPADVYRDGNLHPGFNFTQSELRDFINEAIQNPEQLKYISRILNEEQERVEFKFNEFMNK